MLDAKNRVHLQPENFMQRWLYCPYRRIKRLHAGEQFGDMSCWTGRCREHSVMTITQTEVQCLARSALLALVQQWPELGSDFDRSFAKR